MPWKKADMDKDVYEISKYVKEDLPTWDEIYNVFYKGKMFKYNSQVDKTLDHYWKIPRSLYVITMMCNQFNKNLYEDNIHDSLICFIKDTLCRDDSIIPDTSRLLNVKRAMWAFLPVKVNETAIGDEYDFADNTENYIRVFTTHDFPPIYTYPDPDGKENEFIVNYDVPRIHVDNKKELDTELDNIFVLSLILETDDHEVIVFPTDHELFNEILEFVMRRYRRYFEGEGIGWKDKEGHVVDKENPPPYDIDPAL